MHFSTHFFSINNSCFKMNSKSVPFRCTDFPLVFFSLNIFCNSFFTFPNQLKRPSGIVINLAIWIAQRTHSQLRFPSLPPKKKKWNPWSGLSKRIFPVSLHSSGVFFFFFKYAVFLGIFSLKFEHFLYIFFSLSQIREKPTARRTNIESVWAGGKVNESQRNQPRMSV